MIVKISCLGAAEALSILEETLTNSFRRSHFYEDSELTVKLHDEYVKPVQEVKSSVRQSEHGAEEKTHVLTRPYEDFNDVWTFSILSTFSKRNAEEKSRANLACFYRSVNAPDQFVKIDVGEFGETGELSDEDLLVPPFWEHDLLDALMHAKKKTRVEVSGSPQAWERILGFAFKYDRKLEITAGISESYHVPYPCAAVSRDVLEVFGGQANLRRPTFRMQVWRDWLTDSFVAYATVIARTRRVVREFSPSRGPLHSRTFFTELWNLSPLCDLVHFFQLRPQYVVAFKSDIRWRGQWEICLRDGKWVKM